MKSPASTPTLVLALWASLAAAAAAQTPVAKPANKVNQCFYSNQYQGFRPINDHSFYIRVNVNDFYRIDLSGACPELLYPESHLITVVRGSDLICGPLDWDLRVGQPQREAGTEACIVSAQTKLSKEEAAAIPPKLKP